MIELKKVTKSFGKKIILNNFSLKIGENDFIGIHGVSGSGKTTLLNICGLMERPDSGVVIFDELKNPSFRQTQSIRKRKIGYLFQNYGLVENETVQQNLSVAFYGGKLTKKEQKIWSQKALEQVGLFEIASKKIYELSGGEQQRVALARLLIKKPNYIFADEPTGNLDQGNAEIVFSILENLVEEGLTVLFVSHDQELVGRAKTVIKLGQC
ncbi:hypothetical protein IGI37_001288 [Enterococcus sp. AZ194]|uniref:ABC transporter ATP-binding protein n=1 Tax=Enterococcus sp. AZ194 TaxID=2774629 RepID=UPI003F2735FB